MSIGIPVKLLHEALGHTITIELKTAELYRGILATIEDNMNMMVEGVTVTAKDGKVTTLEQVYIRGSQIRFVIVPDMLRHAPMFKGLGKKGGASAGVGVIGVGAKKAINMRERQGRRGGPPR
uniref:Small nuclear ribonucleoprotein Sm D3 n=1 Tax=Chromera velia CCMP2878 TaxID=1169474 RepID=A0A0G4GXL8_9ALVE|mmetsp:Transcript_23716/g.46588  ORF Transcript_23716/g.46588 Transcript_23716/m.46588 type:complete len:122 (+) Transcript_23716:337-702(+)|eukprot:Cvel_781.t1-p1 / transcript=Cvel_781.t1 / gene=Cvel_781 / organism=Chromera_velia_CCMP2878 / gene_product=Small nuclear ribonucleoprotein Sm D3, putative / transcript_product=Small nuclear ribonucleoprotein Sm D3, putative / location=Cvel_scaffold24:93918-95873(-) / protein_length=121 / sequence_SO=supercontig / SO=protein_coding / is_pseudo=false